MTSTAPRVCIDARIPLGRLGGIEQVVMGLASGFGQIRDTSLQIEFLITAEMENEIFWG